MSTVKNTKERRAWQNLFSQFDKHIKPHLPGKIVLAISGGPDSRAMLEGLARWPLRLLGQWLVISIDHGIRPQSALESKLIIGRAKALGFAAEQELLHSSPRENEQSLRVKRYAALEKAAK
ncbi:MAG TPA: ATP-binding protein, partial [Myxococcota bacterium]|nr:ATP-binding protein [Myxococcota bacterium]